MANAQPRKAPPHRVIPMAQLGALVVLSGVAALWSQQTSGSGPRSTLGPEGVGVYRVANVAPAGVASPTGATIDGVTCRPEAQEVVKYHIHIHLAVYVDGQLERIPAGIGITTPPTVFHYPSGTFIDVGLRDCLYWIHTHVSDGIIHVEAPAKANFYLRQFFDIWGQDLSSTRVGSHVGPVTAFVNGHVVSGSPRDIALTNESDIQLDIGRPVVPFQPLSFIVTGNCGAGSLSCSPTTSTTSR